MNTNEKQHRAILQSITRRAMLDRGLLADFSAEALAELAKIHAPATMNGERYAIFGIYGGLPLTTMTPVTWINLPLPQPRRTIK
jgi:hypothetical protein